MAEPTSIISLEVVDTPILEQTKFEPDMQRWLSNLVDILNASFTSISNYTTNLITASGYTIPGGATSFNVPVTGLTASGYVNVNTISQTVSSAKITSVTAGLNQFTIVYDIDPGVSVIVYQAFITQP